MKKTPRGRNHAGFFNTTGSLYLTRSYRAVGARPRINPAITDIANNTIATKNTIFAASIATPAIMPKPSKAATKAMIKNVTAQPNMAVFSIRFAACRRVTKQRHILRLVPVTLGLASDP